MIQKADLLSIILRLMKRRDIVSVAIGSRGGRVVSWTEEKPWLSCDEVLINEDGTVK